MNKYIETAKTSKKLKSHWDVGELKSHLAVVLRNYFILRLAQLSWGLDTSSGEFSYSDLRHYWPQLSASPPEDPASGAEAAGGNVCLHPSHCSSDPGGLLQAEHPSFLGVDTSL